MIATIKATLVRPLGWMCLITGMLLIVLFAPNLVAIFVSVSLMFFAEKLFRQSKRAGLLALVMGRISEHARSDITSAQRKGVALALNSIAVISIAVAAPLFWFHTDSIGARATTMLLILCAAALRPVAIRYEKASNPS